MLTVISYLSSSRMPEPEALPVPPLPKVPPIGESAKQLLIEASDDEEGQILRLVFAEGKTIETNRKNFTIGGDKRSEARWEAALKELERYGLIEAQGYQGELFKVTDEGFTIADLLRNGVQ